MASVAVLVSALLLSLFRILLNAIDPYLSRINIHVVKKPPSSVEKLLATIRAKSGSLPSLAQNPQWRERLQLALDYLRTAEDLTPFGRWTAYGCLLREVNTIQCFETVTRKFPQLAVASHSSRPVFIIGLPRAGTTLLHNLLSLYPNVLYPTKRRGYFADMSSNDVEEASSLDDLRRRMKIASKRFSMGFEVFSKSIVSIPYSVHPISLDEPDECFVLLNKYLFYETLPLLRGLDFMIVADRYEELSDEAYRLYKRDLHVMQSIAFPGERSCFVVKAPYHTPFVHVILRHFPDALFVRMHRNPVDVLASGSSLLRALNVPFVRADASIFRRRVRGTVYGVTKELVRQTPRMPEDTVDVRYETLVRDPIAVCRKISVRAGMEHTRAMDEKLAAFLAEDKAKRTKAGKHVYTLEEFDPVEIRRDLKEYCEMFGV